MAVSDLTTIKVTETLDPKFHLSTLPHTATVAEAIKVFKKVGVYSLPVVDASQDGVCIGLLDLGDLVFHLAASFYKHTGVSNYEALWATPTTDFKGALIEQEFNSAPVASLLNTSGANPYSPLPADTTTVHDAINALTKARRLPLVDAHGKVVYVISQTNIIRYLGKHKDLIPAAIAHKSIQELAAVTRPVLNISESHRAIDAFALLAEKQFSAVAISASGGEPVTLGTISVKDLALLEQDFSFCIAPVEEYIKTIRQQDLHTIYPTIGCAAESTLEEVIAKFAATRLHRLLVHPVGSAPGSDYDGVISLGNVLRTLASHL